MKKTQMVVESRDLNFTYTERTEKRLREAIKKTTTALSRKILENPVGNRENRIQITQGTLGTFNAAFCSDFGSFNVFVGDSNRVCFCILGQEPFFYTETVRELVSFWLGYGNSELAYTEFQKRHKFHQIRYLTTAQEGSEAWKFPFKRVEQPGENHGA